MTLEADAEIAKVVVAVARIEEQLSSMRATLESQSREMLREMDVRDRQMQQLFNLHSARIDADRVDAQRQVTGLRADLEPRLKVLEARPELTERMGKVEAHVDSLRIGWSRLLGAASVAGVLGGGVAAAVARGIGA